MKKLVIFLLSLIAILNDNVCAQSANSPVFSWGNASYFDIKIGESIIFNKLEIKLLKLNNLFNQLKIGNDTILVKVSQRSQPIVINGLRLFVADNKNLKAVSENNELHSLLTRDALICVCDNQLPYLPANEFIFPVSFNDGFIWTCEEDSYQFSIDGGTNSKQFTCYGEGIDFDLHDARGLEKHWLVALENSKVVWIENEENTDEKSASVLLESQSNKGIYYLYKHLNRKKIVVKMGSAIVRGEPIGTIWGDKTWGHLSLVVVFSKTEPKPEQCKSNVVNAFPQIYSLYFSQPFITSMSYKKGRLFFGKPADINRNQKNALSYEDYTGRGWNLGYWNKAGRVAWVTRGNDGNVRLKKTLFEGSMAESKNPENWFEYAISVSPGAYRIRAKIGDVNEPGWQKLSFEGVDAGTYTTEKGGFVWSSEKVVKVTDGKLTVKIYIDETNRQVSGISEIVFQRAY